MKKIFAALFLAVAFALSLAACGGTSDPSGSTSESQPKSADLSAFYDSLTAAEDFPAMMLLEEGQQQDAYYPGLNGLAVKQKIIALAAISSVACEIALVEVEDPADLDAVKAAFQARIDYQVGDGNGPGGAFYPETTENWKNNSRISSNGNTVLLAVCDNPDDVLERFQALFA